MDTQAYKTNDAHIHRTFLSDTYIFQRSYDAFRILHVKIFTNTVSFLGSYRICLHHTSVSVSDVAAPPPASPPSFFLDLSSAPAARTINEVKDILDPSMYFK